MESRNQINQVILIFSCTGYMTKQRTRGIGYTGFERLKKFLSGEKSNPNVTEHATIDTMTGERRKEVM